MFCSNFPMKTDSSAVVQNVELIIGSPLLLAEAPNDRQILRFEVLFKFKPRCVHTLNRSRWALPVVVGKHVSMARSLFEIYEPGMFMTLNLQFVKLSAETFPLKVLFACLPSFSVVLMEDSCISVPLCVRSTWSS